MQEKILNLQNKLFGKGSGKSLEDEETQIDVHHCFMRAYGWIPLSEYRNMPLITFFDLLERINNNNKESNSIGGKK